MYRNIGDPNGESGSLTRLGDAQLAAGLPTAARQSWEQALTLQSGLPDVDSRPVRGRLAQLAASADTETTVPA